MTVIAWDGITLAADRRACWSGMSRSTAKIFRLSDGRLAAVAGDGASGLATVAWIESGADPATFPEGQQNRDTRATVAVFSKEGIDLYESEPTPMRVLDGVYVDGSGRDYAMAAMYCGKTAREAVEIACLFDPACGNGIDSFQLTP